MSRSSWGGARPGAGRKKGVAGAPKTVKRTGRRTRDLPLDILLATMNDESVDAKRRDRAAIAALPFVHSKVTFVMTGPAPIPAGDRDNGSVTAIRHLRRGVAIIVEHGDAETANWWASRINEYEGSVRHGFNRLDEILRLIPPKGGRSWADIEKLKQRDHWLRIAARRHYSGCPSSTAQAKSLSQKSWSTNR